MSTQPPGEVRGPAERRRRLSGGAIASGLGIAALVTFMVQNTDDVRVDFLTWDFTLSVWLLTLTSAIVGAVIWIGLGVLRRHRRRKERRQDRRD
jgi:uncharacterized integral membrane protein